jgi:Fe-S cluster assembly scaffold protein SufB
MLQYELKHTTEYLGTDSVIIDDGSLEEIDITIAENTEIRYLFLPRRSGTFSRKFHLAEWSRFSGSTVLALKQCNLTLETSIEWDNIESVLAILALAQNDTHISIQWISSVLKPYRKISTRVDQTNILIGTNTTVRWIPILNVATDDIEGGHSCKVHRLGGEALFYLQARGLETKDAEALLLSGEIRRHLNVIPTETIKEELFHNIIHSLK